jgi:hypothetical protein
MLYIRYLKQGSALKIGVKKINKNDEAVLTEKKGERK